MQYLVLVVAATHAVFPKPGQTILKIPGCSYRIDEFLDSGSSSRIYAATCVESEDGFEMPEHAAIKYLCTPKIDYLDHVDQEVRTLGRLNRLNSPNIVRAYYASDTIRDSNGSRCRFTVMSRTGKDMDRTMCFSDMFRSPVLSGLTQVIRGGFSVELFAASVGLQLIDAVRSMHEAGITHGDLYHYNIALSYPDAARVVVIDFGGALEDDAITPTEVQNRRRSDVKRVIEFVRWAVEQRIEREHGKEARRSLRMNNRFVAYLEGLDDLESLSHWIIRYLEVEENVDWRKTDGTIIYM